MAPWLIGLAVFIAPAPGAVLLAEGPKTPEVLLEKRLNDLESRVIQGQGKPRTVRDLMTRQDLRIADQELRSLKTRDPRNATIPRLQRSLDRARRPSRLFEFR